MPPLIEDGFPRPVPGTSRGGQVPSSRFQEQTLEELERLALQAWADHGPMRAGIERRIAERARTQRLWPMSDEAWRRTLEVIIAAAEERQPRQSRLEIPA